MDLYVHQIRQPSRPSFSFFFSSVFVLFFSYLFFCLFFFFFVFFFWGVFSFCFKNKNKYARVLDIGEGQQWKHARRIYPKSPGHGSCVITWGTR